MESQGVPLLGGEKGHEIYLLIDLWHKAPNIQPAGNFLFCFSGEGEGGRGGTIQHIILMAGGGG